MTQFLITGEYQCAGLADLLTLAPESSHWHRAVRACGKISLFMSLTNPVVDPTKPLPPGLDINPGQIKGLFDFALDILNEIGNWHRTLPESWKQPTSQKPPPECGIDDDIFEIDPRGLWAPGYVAMFYCAEILFYTRLNECMKSPLLWLFLPSGTVTSDLIASVATFPRRIEYLLSSLCALLRLIFGDFQNHQQQQRYAEGEVLVSGQAGGSYMLLGPLWLAIHCPFASPEQVKTFRAALEHIGGKMGFRLAMSLLAASPD
jgi:hypothetical protein